MKHKPTYFVNRPSKEGHELSRLFTIINGKTKNIQNRQKRRKLLISNFLSKYIRHFLPFSTLEIIFFFVNMSKLLKKFHG